MAVVLPQGKQQFFDANGDPAVGWKLYTYVPLTSTPKDTYTTYLGNVANTNPVVMNSRGEAAIYWVGSYDATLKTDADVTVWGPERIENPASTLQDDLADVDDEDLGAGMIGYDASLDYAVGTVGAKLNQFVHVEDHGAVGDGSTDDEAAILAGIAAANLLGVPLWFDGSKTYAVDAASWSIAAGAKLRTNGATIKCMTTTTGNTVWLTVNANCRIDELNVSIPTAIRRDRAIEVTGDDWQIGKLLLTSVDQQDNDESDDGGLQLSSGARGWLGYVRIANYDRPMIVHDTASCTIGRVEASSYVRGLYLYDNEELEIWSGRVHTASPNANGTAGDNGVLMGCTVEDAQINVTIRDFTVEDATEHAWRVGGPEQQSNLRFVHCSARNAGGCGFKALGTDAGIPTETNRNIILDHFIAEDVGTDVSLAAQNRAGILLKFVNGVQVTAPIVRPKDEATSAAYGIVMDGVSNVFVTTPFITTALNAGILLQASDGDNVVVSISGGVSKDNGTDGIGITTASGKTSSRITVEGLNLESNTDKGVDIANSGTMTLCLCAVRTDGNTAGGVACNTNNVKLQVSSTAPEIVAAPLSGISATNGSWYDDSTTLNIRKAGAWTAL